MNLPGGVSEQEVDKMISTVDRNNDGRISFSEFRWTFQSSDYPSVTKFSFRVMMGGFPLVISDKMGKMIQLKSKWATVLNSKLKDYSFIVTINTLGCTGLLSWRKKLNIWIGLVQVQTFKCKCETLFHLNTEAMLFLLWLPTEYLCLRQISCQTNVQYLCILHANEAQLVSIEPQACSKQWKLQNTDKESFYHYFLWNLNIAFVQSLYIRWEKTFWYSALINNVKLMSK